MKFLKHIILATVLSVIVSNSAEAASNKQFPTGGPVLDKKVKFWELIFNEYSTSQLVVHDLQSPDLIVAVLDNGKVKNQKTAVRLAPYSKLLKDFAVNGRIAQNMSPAHKKLWKTYSKDSAAKSRLLSGRVELRTQLGLSDTFHEAALRAQLYLPRMEKIFKEHGLPTELTRLPFVESMFNVKAVSKVGASGLWQLMPAAARDHIVVSRHKDERNSPIRATYAAAKIMKANYARLKNWPLAVTAYNHGANGIKRGVDKLGSDNLSDLILSYRSPSFGFASQNFYASFVAAQRSYDKWQNKRLASAAH